MKRLGKIVSAVMILLAPSCASMYRDAGNFGGCIPKEVNEANNLGQKPAYLDTLNTNYRPDEKDITKKLWPGSNAILWKVTW